MSWFVLRGVAETELNSLEWDLMGFLKDLAPPGPTRCLCMPHHPTLATLIVASGRFFLSLRRIVQIEPKNVRLEAKVGRG